jgi:hypothetical protein
MAGFTARMNVDRHASFQCLTLSVKTRSNRPDWLELRRISMQPPPPIPGLRARSWRATQSAVVGHYLFDNLPALERVHHDLADHEPALGKLQSLGPFTERIDALPASVMATMFDRPVFILSAPRAGSTLLFDLLELCDQLSTINGEMQHIVDGIPHLHLANRGFRSQVLDETDADPRTASTLLSCLFTEIQSVEGRSVINEAFANRPRKIRLLEKTPENSLRVPFLKQIFPDARFIYLHRDLRQNVSSIVEAWRHPGFVAIPSLPEWSREQWSFLLPERWRDYDGMSLCHVAAFQWSAANQAIIHGLESIPADQWTTVSYADLLADPEGEVFRLCKFMDVDPGPRLTSALTRPLALSPTTLTPPSPIKWKSNPDFDPTVVRSLQPLAGRIRNLRVHEAPPVSRAQHKTKTRFACFVDELAPNEPPGDVFVSPSLQVQLGNSVPLAMVRKTPHRERFLSDHPMLWANDSATDSWTPLWLRRSQAWLCSRLKPGFPPPGMLTGKLRDQMFTAGVLTTEEIIVHRQRHGEFLVRAGSEMLERLRYCKLPQLLDRVPCQALSAYYRQVIASGDWPLGDAQVQQRHGWHNERVAQFVHYQLTAIVSRVAGRSLKPTYSFASAYRGGAKLDAHMDREQCDYTLSLLVDEKIPVNGANWPLWFQTPDGQQDVHMAVGDGVLFRGCELAHWRKAASTKHEQINLLFHFVPAEWAGVMD